MPDRTSEYIQSRVEGLTEYSEEIRDQEPSEVNSFDSWSALKLILHSAAVNMYTTIIPEYMGDFYYIDALAGSGVSEYDNGQCFVGSPIVAAKAATEPFSKMYFIEENEDYCTALNRRLDYVFSNPEIDIEEPDDWEVIPGDANENITEVVDEIWEESDFDSGFNYFCLVDNQGLNVTWDSIEDLAPKPHGDLLINFPTSQAVGRNALRDERGAINDFFGFDIGTLDMPDNGVRSFLKNVYLENLADLDRGVQCSTEVNSGVGSYYYDMIYATRETNGGSEYIEVIEYVKEFIENVNGGDVDDMLEILNGDQSTIEGFMPADQDIEESLPEEEEDDTQQLGLGDFQ